MRIGMPRTLRGRLVLLPAIVGVVLALAASLGLVWLRAGEDQRTRELTVRAAAEVVALSSGLAVKDRNADYLRDTGLPQILVQDAFSGVRDIIVYARPETGFDPARALVTCRLGPNGRFCTEVPILPEMRGTLAALWQRAYDASDGASERIETPAPGLTLFAAPVSITTDGVTTPHGMAVAISPNRLFTDTVADEIEVVLLLILLMLALSLVIYWLLKRLVTQPVAKLAASARAVATTGEIATEAIATRPGDAEEISELVDCFNAMTSRVRETNDNLKTLVDQRTRALADTNADLTETLARAKAYSEELAEAKAGLEGLNRDLVSAVERAEEASQAKSEFLARMNHEIRNPLNSIIQRAEYLQEIAKETQDETTDEDFRETLEEFHEETTGIMNKSQHLLGVINQVLDMSKIESGKIEPELHARDIILLVEEVRDMAEPMVAKNRSRLIVEASEDGLGEMVTDVTMLRQCLLNLLSNAAKFTSEGEVHLSVRAVPPSEAAARMGTRAGEADEWIAFVVRDTGIGMTPGELDRIFTPFTQANETISAHYGGTGLGLSLTQKFCQALGGDISMTSQKGVGTTATILLPRIFESDGASATVSRVAASGKARRILVIDDDTAFHDQIAEALSPLRADIHHARTADSGMTVCRALRPDAIVLDILMPMKDGYSFLEELRAQPDLAGIPVLIVTETEPTDAVEQLRATGFFSKPLSSDRMEGLIAMVRDVLSDRMPDRVLIVDDEDPVRRTLRRSFEAQGVTVIEAANGAEALDRLGGGPIPDLVIMDLVMPGMDGFTAIGRMRETPAWATIPIIVLTSKDLTRNERRFVMGATEGLLDKNTVPLNEVVHQVARLVEGRTNDV